MTACAVSKDHLFPQTRQDSGCDPCRAPQRHELSEASTSPQGQHSPPKLINELKDVDQYISTLPKGYHRLDKVINPPFWCKLSEARWQELQIFLVQTSCPI